VTATQPNYEVACPHEKCRGVLQVPSSAPPGRHLCICHATWLTLSWTDGAERQPTVRIADDAEGAP
jgi:hypothetical protein